MTGRPAVWIIAAGVVAVAIAAILTSSGAPPPIGRGSQAPEFTLPRLDGGARVDLDGLRGRVVLINFWATWCKPCEEEMPAMQRLYDTLAPEGFELLAVSVDEDPSEVASFVERMGLTFPVLMDSDQRVARSYQTFRFPETLLIGRDGVVVERYVGPKEWDAAPYLARLRKLLSGRGPQAG
jgi:peroxiredoxin